MKKIILSALCAIAFSFTLATAAEAHHTDGAPAKMQAGHINPTGTLVEIGVNGLVCDFCVRALEKVFMKRGEIAVMYVNLDDKRILFSFHNDADINDEALRKLFTDAGYSVTTITRKPGHA